MDPSLFNFSPLYCKSSQKLLLRFDEFPMRKCYIALN